MNFLMVLVYMVNQIKILRHENHQTV